MLLLVVLVNLLGHHVFMRFMSCACAICFFLDQLQKEKERMELRTVSLAEAQKHSEEVQRLKLGSYSKVSYIL